MLPLTLIHTQIILLEASVSLNRFDYINLGIGYPNHNIIKLHGKAPPLDSSVSLLVSDTGVPVLAVVVVVIVGHSNTALGLCEHRWGNLGSIGWVLVGKRSSGSWSLVEVVSGWS